MDKKLRMRSEMFDRVRNFGAANRDVFPETSSAGQGFGQVAAVVQAIEDHLTRYAQARTEARRVRASTRNAVTESLKVITSTGRAVVEGETGAQPFRMPKKRSMAMVLAAARYVIEQAEQREEEFVKRGMPPTFLADFKRQVDELVAAIGVRQDSRRARGRARAGIAAAIATGNKAIRQLDVVVTNILRPDPVRLGEWLAARDVDGPSSSSPTKKAGEEVTPADPPTPDVEATDLTVKLAS